MALRGAFVGTHVPIVPAGNSLFPNYGGIVCRREGFEAEPFCSSLESAHTRSLTTGSSLCHFVLLALEVAADDISKANSETGAGETT